MRSIKFMRRITSLFFAGTSCRWRTSIVCSCADGEGLIPAVLLMGPTASGKSALALALAERFPVEIVSVDSAQVYIDMNVGTAKPDADTLRRYPHHLIDLITPNSAIPPRAFAPMRWR